MSPRSLIMVLYSLVSWAGLYTVYFNHAYQNMYGYINLDSFDLLPYVLNFILVIILASPLKNSENILVEEIKLNNKVLSFVEFGVILLTVINVFLQYQMYSIVSSLSLGDLYDNASNGEHVVFGSSLMNVIYVQSRNVINIFTPVIYIIEFAELTKKHRSKSFKPYIIIALLFVPQILGSILMGSRGALVLGTAQQLFFLAYFWPKMTTQAKRTITFGCIGFGLLIIFYLIAISISRYESKNVDTSTDAWRYFGESFVNLNAHIWNVDGRPLLGERMFPTLYSLYGNNFNTHDIGEIDLNYYYMWKSGYKANTFNSFYGDFVIEYGWWLPFFIILLYVSLLKFLQKKVLKNTMFSLVIPFVIYGHLTFGLFGCNINETKIINLLVLTLIAYFMNRNCLKKH